MYIYVQLPILLKLLKLYKVKLVASRSVPFVKLKEYLLIPVLTIMSPSILIVEVSLYHILLCKSVVMLQLAKLLGFVNS